MVKFLRIPALIIGLGLSQIAFGNVVSIEHSTHLDETTFELGDLSLLDSYEIITGVENGVTHFTHTYNFNIENGSLFAESFDGTASIKNKPGSMDVNVTNFKLYDSLDNLLQTSFQNTLNMEDLMGGSYYLLVKGVRTGNGKASLTPSYAIDLFLTSTRGIEAPIMPVPEPSEWSMMMIGLSLMGFVGRKRLR